MRHRSPKNYRPQSNPALVAEYRMNNPRCEIGHILKAAGLIKTWSPMETQLHHIMGSRKGRWDLLTNLISVSPEVHEFCHANRTSSNVLCLWMKMDKGELCWSEFETASGYKRTVVENWKPGEAFLIPLWDALVASERNSH